MHADLRERRLLDAFCVGTLLATVAWWIGVFADPRVAPMTLGSAFEPQGRFLLLLGDLFAAVLIPAAILICVRRWTVAVPALLWIHFGGQAYAFLVSVVGAVVDPRASLGVFAMMFSAGAALIFALRSSKVTIIWGPFRFRDASAMSTGSRVRQTLVQTGLMWFVFLAVIPSGFVAVETWLGWRLPALSQAAVGLLALAFVLAGSIGIWSGLLMAREGDGTPLPSAGTTKLVVSGPYRVIRNPMALTGVIQGVCVGLMLQSGLTVVYAILGAVAWEVLVRPLEEANLDSKLGETYRAYRQRVRCWIPSRALKR